MSDLNYNWLQAKIDNAEFSDEDCLQVLRKCIRDLPGARRSLIRRQGRAVLAGLYCLGGFRGLSKWSYDNPNLVRYLNCYLSAVNKSHTWAAIYVSHNTLMPLHRDLGNLKGSLVLVKGLGDFRGGGLWVQSADDSGPVVKTLPTGCNVAGKVYDIKAEPVVFSGRCWHQTEEWLGTDRWVLSAYTPRDCEKALPAEWSQLESWGFPVAGIREGSAASGCARGLSQVVDDGSEGTVDSLWEVSILSPVIEEADLDLWRDWHEKASRLCRLLLDELCEAGSPADVAQEIAMQLRQEELRKEWLEKILEWSHPVEEVVGAVRALQSEIALNPEGHPGDQFLQTRSVGLQEARKELGMWREPGREEVTSLEVTNAAVERVKARLVDQWVSEGISVIQLPRKAVLTRKSGTGRRRFRAVCCGNYLPPEQLGLTGDDVYAAGAEALTLRVSLTFASMFPLWVGVTIDIKSAFLYAPIRVRRKGSWLSHLAL